MAKAIWNGQVIAESETFEMVENNVYFSLGTIRKKYFETSNTKTTCP